MVIVWLIIFHQMQGNSIFLQNWVAIFDYYLIQTNLFLMKKVFEFLKNFIRFHTAIPLVEEEEIESDFEEYHNPYLGINF